MTCGLLHAGYRLPNGRLSNWLSLHPDDTKPTTVKWPIGLECIYCNSVWMSFFQQYNHGIFPSLFYHLSISVNNITALFTNMRILKIKSQLTIAFFAAVNHLNGPLRKQNFTLTGSKGQGLWFVIGGFRSVLCVSVFQGSLLVIVIMIDGNEKRNCEGGFWTLVFACLWKMQ